MNQTTIIKELIKMPDKNLQILYRDTEGYKTPQSLFDMGIVICYYCGEINSIDDSKCPSCREDKFIIKSK